jgi:hypothetical protein
VAAGSGRGIQPDHALSHRDTGVVVVRLGHGFKLAGRPQRHSGVLPESDPSL